MRRFTYEEAQSRVPELERIFSAVSEIRARTEAKARAVRGLESGGRPDPAQLAIERSQLQFLAQSLEEALRGVERLGGVLKGVSPGLVDFPSSLDGRAVYLCWREGEKRIRHYHGPEEGFSGRKLLPAQLLSH